MVRGVNAPGSFNDARIFGWTSIPALVARWWPVYAFSLLAAAAITLLQLTPRLQSQVMIFLVATPGFVTCATRFRGSFPIRPNVLTGIALTFVLPSVVLQLLPASSLLVPVSSRIVPSLLLLIAVTWIGPKLLAAGCFYLLGAGELTPSESFALGWWFISGDIWFIQFFVGFIGALALVVVLVPVVLLHLGVSGSILGIAGGLLLDLYYFSALMRIVLTSPQLRRRYWEASQNNAQ